ncbi:MAG TPA: single-stranded DNA-binding protein [Clostridiaceae bacterium]|jgi:single-strand DNA-binding protein|nr:single-stranded DNA-binding protein [Clostridiaceae bacterium]HBF78128.1 single-stranded DNA-binding protein [Clostridiaceae bacterium]HBG39324.1 single-stranded DNA-binding protein [Clostridiaceae bacterium]HBN27774.1 single-stranded DNA-binding protein [Clostridiaceae bacterium]HBX48926.1 single-stranded DNA-binding protein [Clostridiaceae bacterium]
MLNKVVLIGRLTKDPELKFTPGSGVAVASFTLAVERNFVNQSGQREADFIPIICWRKLAENVANNLGKGRLVAVSGRIQTRSYQAQDGSRRYVTEIIADEVQFLDWPKDGNGNRQSNNPEAGVGTTNDDVGFMPVDGEEEVPF